MSNPYDPNNPYGGPIPSGGGGGYGGGGYGSGGYGTPYGQSGAYGNELPKKTDAVSIVGFVLSLTCCLSIVGAILGFVGLGRTSGGKRKGRWAAIAASIIGVLGTIGAVVGGVLIYQVAASVVTIDEARQGICVDVDDSDNDAVSMTEKECTEEHDAEIVYAGDAGEDAARLETPEGFAVCEERIREETPELAAVLDGGDFEIGAVIEDPDNVSSGDKLVCYAEPVTGSLDEKLAP